MNRQDNLPDSSETAVPIGKGVIATFAQAPAIGYAIHDNGSMYISNGQYIMKADQAEIGELMEQANKRRRTESEKISLVEKKEILSYIDSGRGKFELAQEPLEFEISDRHFISLFSDDKQYFGYNKKYVDIFSNGENRLLVDDNASYETLSHNMIVKSRDGEVLGVVLPIRLNDEIYAQLADILPLKVKWKTELERIRENPTNDPYIGREFSDGRDDYIVSALREVNGSDVYIVPNIADGKLSRYAAHIKAGDMESQIMRWEADRLERENEKADYQEQARTEAEKKAEYEDTRGFADNFPPARKANALKALNGDFNTKDYGNLSAKQFIGKAVADGKPLEARKDLKKQYREMDANAYLQGIGRSSHSEVWAKYRAVTGNHENADSPDARWLKSKHPFLHYRIFKDESVLPVSFFNMEYRVKMDGGSFYAIPKTAYDYGRYLMENPGAKSRPPAEKEPVPPPAQEEASPPPRPFTHVRQSPWGEVQASEKLCPGVFTVSAENNGGIMVTQDMTAAFSPAALKCGTKYNGYICFEDNGAKDVALRELLDKKLWAVPGEAKDSAAFEEKINKSLRENRPQYWRLRENRRSHAPPAKAAPAQQER